jgi:hypothetical protein
MKQCTFYRLHDNEKIDNITIDFHTLNDIVFLPCNYVLLSTSQILGGTGSVKETTVNTLALYSPAGRMMKTFYEFYTGDKPAYKHKLDTKAMTLEIIEGKGKSEKSEKFNIAELCKETDGASQGVSTPAPAVADGDGATPPENT